MKIKQPIVLYFIAGMVPTEEELAEGLSMHARFRNASLVEGFPEECDAVAGPAIPDIYKDKPKYGEEVPEFDYEAGEQVGDCYLHQLARGQWWVYDHEGEKLNATALNKADARALALENTEE